jgi:predicted SAM-dependent methyltransferase
MNLERYRNRHGKLWLNVASGNYFLEDFVHLDSNFLVWLAPLYPLIKNHLKTNGRQWLQTYREGRAKGRQFIHINCAKPLPFPSNSVDHILCSHFLEHLYLDNAGAVLDGFHRILKLDGTLHAIVPDLEPHAREYLQKYGTAEASNEFVRSLCFRMPARLHWANRWMQALNMGSYEHCWMFDRHSFLDLLHRHGFTVLDSDDSPSAAWRRSDPAQINVLVRKS